MAIQDYIIAICYRIFLHTEDLEFLNIPAHIDTRVRVAAVHECKSIVAVSIVSVRQITRLPF